MVRFVFTADWHLRQQKPRCRLDNNWLDTQKKQLNFIAKKANEKSCAIIIGGDLFNSAIVSEEIVNMFLNFTILVKKGVYFIAGNHDQNFHTIKNTSTSSIGLLISIAESMKSPYLKSLYELPVSWAHFGQEIQNPATDILFLHQLVFKFPKDIPPNIDAMTAQDLLGKHPSYRYIFVGDMHKPFIYKSKDNRYVINPGHLNRQKVDETDQPCVYFVDTETDEIEKIEIEDDANLITDEYIKNEEDREDRIEAFVEKIKTQKKVSLSFEDNVETAILQNTATLDEITIKLIRFLMEDTNDQFRI